MISKELLSEVLGFHIEYVPVQSYNHGEVIFNKHVDFMKRETINMHELAHKCKEWARDNDHHITSGNRTDGTTRYDVMCAHKDCDIEELDYFFSGIFDTEPEAIFKACEWILNQGKQDGKM